VRLSLTVGVRRQLQQILRVLKIAGATGEVTKADGALTQVATVNMSASATPPAAIY
jgi:hypothetical protein